MHRAKEPGRGAFAAGCDVGGTSIKAVVLRGRRVAGSASVPTPSRGSAQEAVDAILAAVREAVRESGETIPGPLPFAALGVALPGFLDAARSRPIHLSHVPALDGVPLRAVLRRRLRCPVVLDADSNAGAFGEAFRGAGRGARRLLYITLGTGVGAAMVADGEVVRVANHTVGQVAHLPLDPEGPRCACGARGCVESVLGASGILDRARREARRSPLPRAATRDVRALAEAAAAGSRAARGALAESGRLLGEALALLANFLSPDRIVVGGGISSAGDLLLGPAMRAFRKRAHPRLAETMTIRAAGLGPLAGAVGAALLGMRGASQDRPV